MCAAGDGRSYSCMEEGPLMMGKGESTFWWVGRGRRGKREGGSGRGLTSAATVEVKCR